MTERPPPAAGTPDAAPDSGQPPLRVLIVDTASAFGGTLVVARNLLKHLDPQRVDASLVSACRDGFVTPHFAAPAPVRMLAPRVDYVTSGKWKTAIRQRFRWAPLRRALEITVIVAELIANLPYLFRLIRLFRKLRVDVVHVNNYTMEPMWAARLLGIPIIYHLHGLVSPNMDGSGRRNFRRVNAFVSISRVVTESAVRAGIARERVHEIPNFVEQRPEGAPSPLPAEPAIGIFGRVTNWKGQKEFLRAAIQVLDQFPDLRVYVVGDASDGDPKYFDECVAIARNSAYPRNFEFTGRVSDVAAYYRKCSVVVHASTWPEPFGMVLIEAMAEGRPVIASVHGAAPEIVEDGVDGFIVDPKKPHEMATRISELLRNPRVIQIMGERGHQKVRDRFAPHAAAKEFELLYRQIAASAN